MKQKIFQFKQPNPIPFTKQGLEEKQNEYDKLLSERPAAVADLKKARDMGDLSENGYYKSARWKLSDVDRRLRHLRYLLKYGEVVPDAETGTVGINTTVIVADGDAKVTYSIVGDFEANPREKKISQNSPLGKALMGKKVGDAAEFTTQTMRKKYVVISVTKTV